MAGNRDLKGKKMGLGERKICKLGREMLILFPFLPQTSTLLRYADVYNINIRSDCSQAELLAAVRK